MPLNDQRSQQDDSDAEDSDDQQIVEARQNAAGGGEGRGRDQERATKKARSLSSRQQCLREGHLTEATKRWASFLSNFQFLKGGEARWGCPDVFPCLKALRNWTHRGGNKP